MIMSAFMRMPKKKCKHKYHLTVHRIAVFTRSTQYRIHQKLQNSVGTVCARENMILLLLYLDFAFIFILPGQAKIAMAMYSRMLSERRHTPTFRVCFNLHRKSTISLFLETWCSSGEKESNFHMCRIYHGSHCTHIRHMLHCNNTPTTATGFSVCRSKLLTYCGPLSLLMCHL